MSPTGRRNHLHPLTTIDLKDYNMSNVVAFMIGAKELRPEAPWESWSGKKPRRKFGQGSAHFSKEE